MNNPEEKIQELLVDNLKIFTQPEYERLLEFADLSISNNPEGKKIFLEVCIFDKPDAHHVIRFYEYKNDIVKIKIKTKYLFGKNDVFHLIEALLAHKGIDSSDWFKNNFFDFSCPEFFFYFKEHSHRAFLEHHIHSIKSFVSFLLGVIYVYCYVSRHSHDSVNNQTSNFMVFDIEQINTFKKTNSSLGIYVTNYHQHYYLVTESKLTNKEKIKVGQWYEISLTLHAPYGDQVQKYKSFDGVLLSFKESDAPEEFVRKDSSKNKICCLSLHTKMSAFDGLFTFEEFANRAIQFGHKSLGVTDFSGVQSYGEVEQIAKKTNIKPLYGCEFEVIEDQVKIIVNEEYIKTSQTYCLFDIETTGLHPLFDEIIEIAISKYKDQENIDNYHSYIKIDRKLKDVIINLTKITDEVLETKGRDIKEVLKEVSKFVEGSILIAHNGIDFDWPFLSAQYIKNALPALKRPLLDTMVLSKALYAREKFKSHALTAIAKRFNCVLEEDKFHSAAYDTSLLYSIWTSMKDDLIVRGFDFNDDIAKLNVFFEQKDMMKNKFGKRVLVYAKNQAGIKSIYKLVSTAHVENFIDKPLLTFKDIETYKDTLLVVSAAIESAPLSFVMGMQKQEFLNYIKNLDYVLIPPPSHFDHEIKRDNFTQEQIETAIKTMYEWSREAGAKVIINFCAKFLDIWHKEQYRVIVHAKSIGGKRHYLHSHKQGNEHIPDYSFHTTQELVSEFKFLENDCWMDETIKNQDELISQIADNIEIVKTKLHSPKIDHVIDKINKKLDEQIMDKYGPKPDKYLTDKLEYELSRIIENKYEVVYWVAHILVKKSIDDGYLVGSRGSVGSSFVAYLLNISDVDPLIPHYFCKKCSFFESHEDFLESGFDLEDKECPNCNIPLNKSGHNIPFETFLGLRGDKVPDIDLNFSGKYQSTAHNFLRDWFGKSHTFRSGTINTVAKKTSFGLALNYLQDHNQKYNNGRVAWLSKQSMDVKRTTGQHPGGILVVPAEYEICDFTPINYPANDTKSDWLTTHFEFHILHDSLFKFDILGHDDPTFLSLLHKSTGIDPTNITYQDPTILRMFGSLEPLKINSDQVLGEEVGTIGLPEFGTPLTRKILRSCQINYFADLIRLSGISHGTNVWKNNIDMLIKKDNYKLNQVITCRDDIMIYLNHKGLDVDDSFAITESVRKGKGIPEDKLELLRDKKIPEWYIKSANKISYIFPKAHAAAYVLMSWKIAFYKLYHPLEFYAGYFTIHADFFDIELLTKNDPQLIREKYAQIKEQIKANPKATNQLKNKFLMMIFEVSMEMLARNIKFANIDINKSDSEEFIAIQEDQTILIPFISMDGLGKIVAKNIFENRISGGDYLDRENIEKRIKVNNTVLKQMEALNIIPKKHEVEQITISDVSD